MKLRKMASCIAIVAALASVWLGGCGGGSANVVTVTLSQPTATLVVTQVLNLTATVAGATNASPPSLSPRAIWRAPAKWRPRSRHICARAIWRRSDARRMANSSRRCGRCAAFIDKNPYAM